MAPWSAYQKYGDPPGNRLIKWTLAGVVEIDDRGTGETIVDAYGEAGLGGTLHNKARELRRRSSAAARWPNTSKRRRRRGGDGDFEAAGPRPSATIFFFYLLPSLGLLLLAPLAMLAARRRRRPQPGRMELRADLLRASSRSAPSSGALLLFGNGVDRTVIHQGSYLLPLLGLVGGVVGLRAVFPRFARLVRRHLRRADAGALRARLRAARRQRLLGLGAALLAALGLAGFGFVALRGGADPSEAAPRARLGGRNRLAAPNGIGEAQRADACSWAALLASAGAGRRALLEPHLLPGHLGLPARPPGFSVDSFFHPHNEHIVVVPVAITKLLLAVFGMSSGTPEMFAMTATLLVAGASSSSTCAAASGPGWR